MYRHLYDSFKHWYDLGGTVFFLSDPHFGDDEMRQVRKNNISDEEIIKRINKTVGKTSTLVILGDVGDVEWVKEIKAGRKVLIIGNHDKGASNYLRKRERSENEHFTPGGVFYSPEPARLYDNRLFDEVYEGVLMISPKIMLSHEPVKFEFALNIHGHDHSNKNSFTWLSLNVCAEHINYTPVSLNQIVKSGMLSNVPDVHRTTIDKAKESKGKKK